MLQRPVEPSQFTSVSFAETLALESIAASIGSAGDAYDNALAESAIGLFKTELIRRRGPWRTVEQVELATLEWVWRWNNARLDGELDYRTPVEVEQAYYVDQESTLPAIAGQRTG